MSESTKTPAGQGSGIDWKAIHRRLEHATRVLKEKATPTPEEQKKILNIFDGSVNGGAQDEVRESLSAIEHLANLFWE